MPNGYTGQILHVDLTRGKLEIEPLRGILSKIHGGSAMGLYYILREMPTNIDPLAPENVLTIMASVNHRRANFRTKPNKHQWRNHR